MTAIAAVLGRVDADSQAAARRLLGFMRHRGDQPAGLVDHPLGSMGASAFAWEVAAGVADALAVARDGDVVVVADASLYYKDDLRRRLASDDRGATAADLVLRAYRRWGEWFWERLEGDFACVVADAGTGLVIAARDHVGRRPLHYGTRRGHIVIASLARAVGREMGASLNHRAVAAAVGGLLGGSMETGFEGVFPVPAGGAVVARSGVVSVRPWIAPVFAIGGRPKLKEAGEALRAILVEAVQERVVAPKTAVWLSGGADSTAVFGAGQVRPALGRLLAPVSISYPEGDPAREDDYIRATTDHWHAPVTWIDSEQVALFEHLAERVAVRDDPYAHTFEAMNLRLASTSAAIGARGAFDGYGGDQLFHVSDVFLADLFARGRWRELRATMREMEMTGIRTFVSRVVFPWLPDRAREWIDVFRGRDINRGTLVRQSMPSWLADAWWRDDQLFARAGLEPPRRLLESPARYESRWYVETPYFPRAAAWAASLALQAGVAVRSPLLDRRVLDFAASRPLAERVGVADSKLVLREAVRGIIPEEVLAPRAFKTGVPRGYLARQMDRAFLPMFAEVFAAPSELYAMGIVDIAALRRAADDIGPRPNHIIRVQLFLTLQAELWIRSIKEHCRNSG